jgi:glycosyltransferase involved in cell wall biosynthesis
MSPPRPLSSSSPPPVSFVIPSFNQARFIRRCIDDCLAQNVAGAEILVLDGNSSDGTQAILASYGDRLRFVSEPDRGQSDAINKGIRLARGEIIAWINSDDYYADSGVLGRVLGAFGPGVDVVHGDGMLVDVAGQPFRRYRSRDLDGGRALFAHPTAVVQCSVFFRRQLFLDVGALDETLHYAMDYDLWLRLMPAAQKVRYLPEVLSCVRFHESAKTYTGMLAQFAEVRRIRRRYRHGRPPGALLGTLVADAKLYAYWAAVRLGLRRAA